MTPVLRAQYIQWFKKNLPGFAKAYDNTPNAVKTNLAGFGITGPDDGTDPSTAVSTTSSSGDSTNWANVISQIGTAASQYVLTNAQIKASQQIQNVQLQRAVQGLPPLSMAQLQSQYGLTVTPTANVGLAPDTQKFLMFGGIALIAVWVLTSKRSRRR